MRSRIVLAFVPGVLVALAWACGSSGPSTAGAADSGAPETSPGDDGGIELDAGPSPDAPMTACKLSDGTDPVALCLQQQVIGFELQYAFTKGSGVAPGWSSATPFAAVSGHDWRDDLGLAGTLGAYHCSSSVYGNDVTTPAFDAALSDLGGVLVTELQQTPPADYDGETYFRIRWAEAALNYLNDPNGATLRTIGDAYGAALLSHAYTVMAAPDGGVDGGSPGGVVIGTTQNADGSVVYSPAQAVMAAAALLDMAILGAGSPDAGAVQPSVSTAQQVLSYVLARGRDPGTGLFYQSLVTSGDPGHDAVGPGAPTNDAMLTETQAWIMLGLARAQDLLDEYEKSVAADAGADAATDAGPLLETYWLAGGDVATALTNAGLFDGVSNPPPPPATPPVGAFMEGLVLSGAQVLTNKTTLGNAILLGGFHRVSVGQGSMLSYVLGEVRSSLLQLQPAHTSLLSIVTDSNGNLIQQSYLRAGSKAFGYALAFSPAGEGGGGQEPGATDYRSDAVHAMVEGLTQLWHGSSHDAPCAP
jgi:hypothetical protein